ncbi:hypothetical protein PybrP1_007826 [[Pythium] brassicae (nom. inval.)]|nr:hypothetical protein PybrP1_007826 [[Pythium] brassicae (nom. inval.)]
MTSDAASLASPRDVTRSAFADSSSGSSSTSRLRRLRDRLRSGFKKRRRVLFLLVMALDLLYIFVSVPLRAGFYFDPYAPHTGWTSGWSEPLTIFTALDVLCDLAGVASIADIFRARRRAIAAQAANADGGLVTPRRYERMGAAARAGGGTGRRAGRRDQVASVLTRIRSSLFGAWSLNAILPHDELAQDIKRPLVLELLSLVPVEVLSLALGPNALHVLRLLKLVRLYRVPGCVREIKQLYARSSLVQIIEYTANALLLRTIVAGLAMAHWLACVYMLIAHVECGVNLQRCRKGAAVAAGAPVVTGDPRDMNDYTCWAIEDQLVGATRSRKYGRAIYWACRSVITLGYYDVAAVTNAETVYVIVVQIVGAIFSTRVIATCLFIFRHRGARKQEFMARVDSAKAYMKMRRFPEPVREGVLAYYKNVWRTHHGLEQDAVVERLPEHLRVSVMSVLRVQRIQNVSFLAKESVEFVNTLALRLGHCAFSPKDWIVDKAADGMYFVLRGTVVLEAARTAQPRLVAAGGHFAEASLLYQGKSDERARAQTFCELYRLAHSAFASTLEVFHRSNAAAQLERMRSMHTRHDQQEQKMKRMLGRSAEFQRGGSTAGLGAAAPRKRLFQDWTLPGSVFRKWWEHGRLLGLVFVAYEVPFFIVFNSATFPFGEVPKYNIQSLSSVVVEVFFVADFVLRARYFAYIDALAMIPVKDPSYIFEAYKAGGMWLDLVSIVPLPLITEFSRSDSLTYEPFFRLVRLVRLQYLFQVIQDLAHFRGMSSKLQTTLTLFICVTFALHLSGCLWFLMARFSYAPSAFVAPVGGAFSRDDCLRMASRHANCSWAIFDAYGQIGAKFVVDDPASIYTSKFAYARSVYWSVVALTTVGYGDIVAFSTYESYFAAFWVFLGAMINYGVIGAMSNIISNLTAASHHRLETMNHVNLVLAHFGIAERLRQQIRQYYHQQFFVQHVASEAQMLEDLPEQLRHSISLLLHAESVKRVPLFRDVASERLLHDLTGLFRRRLYQRGDAFFAESNLCDEMYVVVRGRVNVFSKRVPSIPVGALSDGDCYGLCELLLQKNFATTLVAVSVVEASVISQAAFAATIEHRFPTEVQALRLRALQDHVFDRLSLEAVIDNFATRPALAKYSDHCTSMFAEKDDWVLYTQRTHVRFYWDLLLFALNLYNAFQITFRVAFLHHPSARVAALLTLLDFAGDAVYAADIYLQLYYFECEAGAANLRTRAERDERYAEKHLRADLLSSLPLYYVGRNFFAQSLCRLPRLLRGRHVLGAMDSLVVRIQQRFASGAISAFLSPLKPVLILLFVSHFAACGFYLISETDHNANSWIHNDHVVHQEHESTGVMYLRAFYWAITTLALVGSKEMTPLGIAATLWATTTCLCCTFVIGHIVDELSELVLEFDKAKKELKEREANFEQFAKDHDLPASIRTRVLHYLKFQHSYLKGKDIYETFRDLSPNLRVQLMLDLHGDTIQNLCIAPFLNQSQINGLAVRFKSELFIPGDTVIVEGDLGNKLYIVKHGAAMVVWKATGTAVAALNPGSLFGEVAFFLRGQRRIASVQATTYSELLLLDRQSWEALLHSCQPDEAQRTEKALTGWVRECLKGYNIMTVEIVKDIKFGGEAPMTIDEMRKLAANQHQQGWRKRHSANTIHEKKVRQLLKKGQHCTDRDRPTGAWHAVQDSASAVLDALRDCRASFSRSVGRVHIDIAHHNMLPTTSSPTLNDLGRVRGNTVVKPRRAGGTEYLSRVAKSLPFLKSPSFKNGTATQLNPVSRSMREYYRTDQLIEMEEECWRRYKVSIFMADRFVEPSVGLLTAGDANETDALRGVHHRALMPDDVASLVKGTSIRAARKTLCGANFFGDGARQQHANRNSVTTDGMRLLANYETRRGGGAGSDRTRRGGGAGSDRTRRGGGAGSDRTQTFHRGHTTLARNSVSQIKTLISDTARKRRKRVLKRSQSLPIFDRHFADMIQQELQESNAKDQDNKLDLGFELLQRCRQPEFTVLFRLYDAWVRKTHKLKAPKVIAQRATLAGPALADVGAAKGPKRGRMLSLLAAEADESTAVGNVNKSEDFIKLLSRCYRLWEVAVVAVAMFYAFSIPYLLCFASETETTEPSARLTHWLRFVSVVDLFCIVDLVLKYTAFQGVLQIIAGGEDLLEDRASGLPLHTALELFAALPLDFLLFLPPFTRYNEHRWFYTALFQLNKISRIYDSIDASERLAQFLSTDLNLPVDDSSLRFVRSICGYVLAGHWIGCVWYITSLHALHVYHYSWLSAHKMLAVDQFTSLDDISQWRRYLRSLHFAVGSITTVFYGDIASYNALETIVEIVIILVCILIYGTLVGAHGERIHAHYQRRMVFEQNLSELSYFVKKNDVPRDVSQRLRLYYTSTWLKYHGHEDFEGIHGLSTLLVEDIAQYTLRTLASRVSILKSCDEGFLRSLLTCLKHVICSPSEAVVRKGDVDRSMYFIARGRVLVKGIGFELIKDVGDFFGELSLLYGIPRSATCLSLGITLLYVLEWQTYEKLLDDYPEYREQNRREWVIVSTVLKKGESRFRSIIRIVAKMEKTNWVGIDEIIRKAKSLK